MGEKKEERERRMVKERVIEIKTSILRHMQIEIGRERERERERARISRQSRLAKVFVDECQRSQVITTNVKSSRTFSFFFT